MSSAVCLSQTDDLIRLATSARTDLATPGVIRRRRPPRLTGLSWVLFIAPGVAVFGLFMLWPLLQTFVLSLQKWDGFSPRQWVGLANYARALSDAQFWAAVEHTVIYTVGTASFKIVLGLALALLLDRKLRGRAFYRSVVFAPGLMSFVAVGLLFQLIYAPSIGLANRVLLDIGLIDGSTTWLGSPATALYAVMLAEVWKWVGYHTVLFIAGLSLVSDDLLESARIDGANAWQTFRYVTLPALRGVMVLNVIIAVAGGANTFDLVYVMTQGGPYGSTDLVMTYMYREAFKNSQFGYASAVACLLFMVVFALTVFMLRKEKPAKESM